MKPKEVLKHYRSYHYFNKETGMSASSLFNWMRWGYVPIVSQIKLERLSGGKLKADLNDGGV